MLATSTFEASATNIGHKDYAPPPKELCDFPMNFMISKRISPLFVKDSVDTKRLITVDFAATVHTSLPWEFVPQQRRVVVGLGEPTGKEGCLFFFVDVK